MTDKNTKQFAIGEMFDEKELEVAVKLYGECRPGTFNKAAVEKIVKPAMARINAATGQENDPSYIAYALEYAISQMERGPKP